MALDVTEHGGIFRMKKRFSEACEADMFRPFQEGAYSSQCRPREKIRIFLFMLSYGNLVTYGASDVASEGGFNDQMDRPRVEYRPSHFHFQTIHEFVYKRTKIYVFHRILKSYFCLYLWKVDFHVAGRIVPIRGLWTKDGIDFQPSQKTLFKIDLHYL